VHAPRIEPEPIPAAGWPNGTQVKVLSRDSETGAFSGILLLPKGYSRPEGHLAADTELLILKGWVRIGEDLRTYGYFDWAPAGTTLESWEVLDDAEILFLPRTAAPDFTPGPGPAGDQGHLRIDSQ